MEDNRAGTVGARFENLLRELEKRFPKAGQPFSSEPPEIRILEELDQVLLKVKKENGNGT